VKSFLLSIALSFGVHAIVLIVVGQLVATALAKKRDPMEMRVLEKKKPPPPEPEPEPPPPPEPPKPKKVLPPVEELKPEAKPEPEPPPEEPKPPPVFSVDMSKTVSGGEGPAVVASEKGSNMFADPKTQGEPGEKQTTRTPGPSGRGGDPNGGGRVEPPKFKIPASERTPPYPRQARRQGIQGQVVLRVCIGTSGEVSKVDVVKPLGFGCDEAAADWARTRWKFEPAKQGGHPIPMCITAPVTFVLE
jgi:protein TonB